MEKRAFTTFVFQRPLLSLIATCTLLNTSHAVQLSWLFDSPFESSNCMNATPTQLSTTIQCARLCGQSNDCVGFYHNKDTLSCLHIDPTASSDCMVNTSPQWTSWKKRTGSYSKATTSKQTTFPTTTTEQTTTPTTTMAQPLCPITIPMDTYTSTTLGDNTQFTFLFVQDGCNQSAALSRCPNYNGTLVQIITAPKMDFLMDCLDKTFEGNDDRFWIDAIKIDGLWKTSDGKDVLRDDNYWSGTSGTKLCVNLQGILYNYKMRKTSCANSRSFICEKTN